MNNLTVARWMACLFALFSAVTASAHPAPFSYLDLDYRGGGIDGKLTVHAIDIAHELDIPDPHLVLHAEAIGPNRDRIAKIMYSRMDLKGPSRLEPETISLEPAHDTDALVLSFRIPKAPSGALSFHTDLFPYDPQHQTFVNIFEDGQLRKQWIISGGSEPKVFYPGTREGVWSVLKTFVPSGFHHILIGPDHLLFLFGLILMGGGIGALVRIVTAFTIGHSVTLALAALDIVILPSTIVEPAIALTIVVVGADNLLRDGGKDLRMWLTLAFGLIHGFGFASVLKEFGLPQEALGWSLFSFNVGVELGQLAVVVPVALLLALLARKQPDISKKVVTGGSIVVIGAGAWWFIQRVFLTGGI